MANVKYNPQIQNTLIAALKGGATQTAAAKIVGITPETLSIWKNKHSAFKEAVERAQGEAQAFAEQSLFDMGKKGNLNALKFWLKNRHPSDLKFWLKNRHPSEWRDKPRQEDAKSQPKTLEEFIAAELVERGVLQPTPKLNRKTDASDTSITGAPSQ